MSRRERGSSRLPVNTSGNLWIEEGVKFFERREDGPRKLPERLKYLSTLHAIVEAYRTGEEAYGRTKNRKNPDGDPGVLFSDIVNELWTNPTAVSDWHDERDEEAAKRLRAFRALCGRIAGEFSQLYPGVEMKVEVSRRMLQRRASERAQVAREDAGETKQAKKREELRRIGSEILEVRKEMDGTVENAIIAYMKKREKDGRVYVGLAKLWAAWGAVKDERDGNGGRAA